MIAIAYPFLINLPSKISAIWFLKRERIFSTSFAILSQVFGVMLGAYFQEEILMQNNKIMDDVKNIGIRRFHKECSYADDYYKINKFQLEIRHIMKNIMVGMAMV
jgi:hypothetical protein